jgi:GntR family transcriptional regulator, transcriptional repressor for pyruvate dehydrogenase complex
MHGMSSQKKVYIEILNKIHDIIENDGLQAGDKLPSERELSDRLNAGRSSVREALRSLELLGLIETRRGEGTFIVDANEYRLIEILGSFILQGDKVVEDLIELKDIIELTAIPLACQRLTDEELEELLLNGEQIFQNPTEETLQVFHRNIVEGSKNRLLYRVWNILFQYYKNSGHQLRLVDKELYSSLLQALKKRETSKASELLSRILNEGTSIV